MKISNDRKQVILELSVHEAVLLNNALVEICLGPDAIDEEEFHARTGSNKDEAQEIQLQLGELIDRMKEQYPEEYN